MKYVETEIVFREIPNKVTLAINVSGCPYKCKGCHSPHLQKYIGTDLNEKEIDKLLKKYKGVECICFMGGDAFQSELNKLLRYIKYRYNILTGWYSGSDRLSEYIEYKNLDYYKIGSYKEELGPLSCESSNQALYGITHSNSLNLIKMYK